MKDKQVDTRMGDRANQQEEPSREFQWAVRAGIMDGAAPQSLVTQEEVSRMLYRTLEYFFGQIIAALKERGT